MYFYKWFRKLNQNLRTILVTILIVAFLFILLQIIFGILRINRDNELKQMAEYNNKIKNDTLNSVENTQNNNTSYSNNSNINTKLEKLVEKFINYCNNNQIEKAYEIISSDCKEAIFPNIEIFTKNYYEKIFTAEKAFKLQKSMYSDVYEIIYYDDSILSTGGISNEDAKKDYIYFIQENGQGKLSINQFLYKNNIEKTIMKDNVSIKITSKQVYIDYEIYSIQIVNNSDKTVLIDSKEKTDTVCLIDNNNLKYTSNISEMSRENLLISPNFATILNLKFYKMYNPDRTIKELQLLDIVKNYDEYMQGTEKDIIKIVITI